MLSIEDEQYHQPNFIPDKILPFNFYDKEIYIQAELYHQCKLYDIECYLEASIEFRGRLDAVLKLWGKFYIIECKTKKITLALYKEQVRRYSKLGYPVIILTGKDEVKPLIDSLLNDVKFNNAIYEYNKILKGFVIFD